MLTIISTPIGNMADISLRAIEQLFSVEWLLCEDTRRAGQLLDIVQERYPFLIPKDGKRPKLIRYDDVSESKKIPEIVEALESGITMGLISDNGTPLVSDPGYKLVKECRKRHIEVSVIPGPSAFVAALTVSGLPSDQFCFIGFLPDKETARSKMLLSSKNGPVQTMIAYASPHRLIQCFETFELVYGLEQRIVVVHELTKMHESIWEGSIEEAKSVFSEPKGEFVLLWRNEQADHRHNYARK